MDIKEKLKCINNTKSLEEVQSTWFPEIHLEDYYFVSYSHKDYKKVYADIFNLQSRGVSIWYDRGMPPSKSWTETAEEHIDRYECKGIIFYISENSIRSAAIHKEIEFAEKCGKEFLIINLPIENDYIFNGKSWKGIDNYSSYELLKILEANGENISDEKFKFVAQRLNDSVLYERYSSSVDKKVDSLNKLKRPQLLDIIKDINKLNEAVQPELPLVKQELSTLPEDMLMKIADSMGDIFSAFRQDVPTSGKDFLDVLFGQDALSVNMVVSVNDINVKKIKEGDFIFIDNNSKRVLSAYYIGYCAFANCRKLKSVELPRIRTIYPYAFFGCNALKTIDLSKVSVIQERAFYGCESLEFINVDADSCLDEVEDYAFSGCACLVGDLHFPDGLIRIGKYAFSYTSIRKIIFNDYTQFYSLGECAFRGCKNLIEVKFPTRMLWKEETSFPIGVPEFIENFIISENAFSECFNLETVTLPNCTKEICSNAFCCCEKLSNIIFGGTASQWQAIKKGNDWDGGTGDYIVYCSDGTKIHKNE